MCDAIRLPLSEFTADQVRHYRLDEYVSEYPDGELMATFRRIQIVPYIHHGQLLLAEWPESLKLHQIQDGSLNYQKPELVEIPAKVAMERGAWFDVDPKRIRGILIPGKGRHQSDRVFVLVRPAVDVYERMTHGEWQPVYVGGEFDPID
tara:strand:- start:32906 stop:33352 length:447 start_codon:yes stop_codon:yes gene_type:complete